MQALERAQAEFDRKYLFRRRAGSNEKLLAETKGLGAETDPKLAVEAQTIPAVTATGPRLYCRLQPTRITPMLSRRTCISIAAPTKFRTRRANATMLFATRLTFGALPSSPARWSTVMSRHQSANFRGGKSRLWSIWANRRRPQPRFCCRQSSRSHQTHR